MTHIEITTKADMTVIAPIKEVGLEYGRAYDQKQKDTHWVIYQGHRFHISKEEYEKAKIILLGESESIQSKN